MKLKIADVFNTREVVHFFSRHLIRGNDGVSTSEFFCPDGVKAAVRRGQVLLALHDKHVIAALRFYRRKTKNSVSLYQFAIDLPYRGKGLLREMLQSLGPVPIEYLCPRNLVLMTTLIKLDGFSWKVITNIIDGFSTQEGMVK